MYTCYHLRLRITAVLRLHATQSTLCTGIFGTYGAILGKIRPWKNCTGKITKIYHWGSMKTNIFRLDTVIFMEASFIVI